jgi:hypothetical protein
MDRPSGGTPACRIALPGILVVAAGAMLGVAARLVDEIAPRWVGDVGAVWFLTGFLVGRRSSRPATGAAAGALCLVTANTTYYLWRLLIDQNISNRYLTLAGLFWSAMSISCGLVSGFYGTLSVRRPALWGIVAGIFGGEALAVLILSSRLQQVVIEAVIALACLLAAMRGRARDIVVSASLGFASVVVLGLSYRVALGR